MKQQTKLRVIKAYQIFKSIRKVSEIIGISYGSVHAILKEANALRPWSGFETIQRWKGGNRGPVTRWIEAHPEVVLPKKRREIAKLIGCSVQEVQNWKMGKWNKVRVISKEIIPRSIIKKMDYRNLSIVLLNGEVLGYEELFKLKEQLMKKEKSK
jgi:hypothetical protein